jgi:hypothetical protein
MMEDLLSESLSFVYRNSVKLTHPKSSWSRQIPIKSDIQQPKNEKVPSPKPPLLSQSTTRIDANHDCEPKKQLKTRIFRENSLEKYLDAFYWEMIVDGYIIAWFNTQNRVEKIEFHYFDPSSPSSLQASFI